MQIDFFGSDSEEINLRLQRIYLGTAKHPEFSLIEAEDVALIKPGGPEGGRWLWDGVCACVIRFPEDVTPQIKIDTYQD